MQGKKSMQVFIGLTTVLFEVVSTNLQLLLCNNLKKNEQQVKKEEKKSEILQCMFLQK